MPARTPCPSGSRAVPGRSAGRRTSALPPGSRPHTVPSSQLTTSLSKAESKSTALSETTTAQTVRSIRGVAATHRCVESWLRHAIAFHRNPGIHLPLSEEKQNGIIFNLPINCFNGAYDLTSRPVNSKFKSQWEEMGDVCPSFSHLRTIVGSARDDVSIIRPVVVDGNRDAL